MIRRRLLSFLVAAFSATCGACGAVPHADRPARVEAMATEYESEWPGVPQISAATFIATPDNQRPLLVDCRAPAERAVSMLPKAITPDQIEANPDAFQETPLIVYCTIGYRSTKLASQLRKRGFNASNLHAGVLGWAHAQQAFVTPDGHTTTHVHVYGATWDLLPQGYESEY
ncbi:MAG: rhodanese-like domain-containing protein [Algisphaera sp.]